MKLSNENKILLGGLLITALGTAGLVAIDASHTDVVALSDGGLDAPVGDATPRGKRQPIDVAAYNAAVREVRQKDPTMVDLLTAEVEPGAEVTTEVTIPAGGRSGEVTPVGPAQDVFEVLEVTHADNPDGTVVRVRAKNTGADAERFVGMFHWTIPANVE